MNNGLTGGKYSVLSDIDLAKIHEASLGLLHKQGILCESDLILDLFLHSGAKVNQETRVIQLSREMVEIALKSAPKSFTMYGREEKYDMLAEVGKVYFGMGGTPEPFIYDYELQTPRISTTDDMVACTRIGQACSNIDFIMALCSSREVPPEQSIYYEWNAIFRNTTKPVICSSPGKRWTEIYIELAAAASGGEEQFRKCPWITLFTQTVSPLKITRYSEGMFIAAEYGVPILASPGPMIGATSPATLAGALAQINAEALFGIVMSQLIKPGTPVIYAPHTGVMDMATAQCTYGSAEQTLARAAVAQLGRFYNLPQFGLGGGVEAKVPDAEAASQAMMGMLMNALSGLTLTQTLGTLGSGLYGSMEMLAICDEIVRMIKRITTGISVTDETLALDVIQEVGFHGSFLTHSHTAENFRKELYFPSLFKRQSIEQWKERGSLKVDEVAHRKVQDILKNSTAVDLPAGADEEMKRVMRVAIQEAK